GDFWAEYLSSLPFTCKIEIMVDTPVSDTNETHLNYIKQTFQVSNQFWIQHNLSVEFHYNKHTSRIYTLPYPKTKYDFQSYSNDMKTVIIIGSQRYLF
ncbi:unnamed protein product, partial [Didymodactylos carnosus]